MTDTIKLEAADFIQIVGEFTADENQVMIDDKYYDDFPKMVSIGGYLYAYDGSESQDTEPKNPGHIVYIADYRYCQ